jgi:7-cyano-7-deazaguanine synthase in queuosine biosynthesis
MSTHRLRISASDNVPALTPDDFLWRPPPLTSSFHTSIGPRAELLGALEGLYIDFISFATLVYLVDLTVPRERPGAERDLDLQVQVSDPKHWEDFTDAFEDLLRFLTGDYWSVRFVVRRGGQGADPRDPALTGSTALLSGGADSFSGAVILGQDGPLTLVSHYSAKGAKPIQEKLAEALAGEWGADPEHLQVNIGRRNEQLGTNAEFPRERSSRSRSLLFIALGLAAASVRGEVLTMAENGFTALNIPLSPERRGSLSTRTTHPAFLAGLNGVLRDAGLPTEVRNPFSDLTKGQLFEQVNGILGDARASQLLSATHSCAKSNMFRFGQGLGPMSHCGVCFGCLVRRGAFIAAGLTDGTTYANEVLTGDARKRFFAGGRLTTWESVRYAVERGFDARDIRAISPPPGHDIAAATVLANAGLQELAAVDIARP